MSHDARTLCLPGGYRPSASRRCGMTLLELILVIVIVGIIAAIAIPRLSRGAEGASEAALIADLSRLRQAIDHYAAEHNGTLPDDLSKLLVLTNLEGTVAPDAQGKAEGYLYGPYLHKLPRMKTGEGAGRDGVAVVDDPTSAIDPGSDNTKAWFYNKATGDIRANLPTNDNNKTRLGEYLNKL